MGSRFEEQLAELNQGLLEMAALAEEAIAKSAKCFEQADLFLAQEVIDCDKEIDEKERDIEAICLRLLLRQQPVAKDLRLISSALKMITDLERIGDQAADICELMIHKRTNEFCCAFAPILQMATIATTMVKDSIDSYVEKNIDKAQNVIQKDDEVDTLFIQVKQELMNCIRNEEDSNEEALDYLMIAKYFERIGDHAVNIASWVAFSITGEHVSK